MDGYKNSISLGHVQRAHNRIRPFIHKTPVLTCSTLDELAGRQLFLKCENFQKTGSFKVRGGLNAILSLQEIGSLSGTVTNSSGNHGQGIAYASQICDVPCSVVVPRGTSEAKIRAIQNYGAEVVICDFNPVTNAETCRRISESQGRSIIPPLDNYNVIAGQGTVALELLEQVPDLDAVIVPICSGDLAAGCATAIKALKPSCKVFIAEPFGKELESSVTAGKKLWANPPKFMKTVADGLRYQPVGDREFPIICDLCENKIFTVRDEDIVKTMKLLWERAKIVVEPSSCAPLAAALSKEFKSLDPEIQKIGVVLTGGNVDLQKLPWI